MCRDDGSSRPMPEASKKTRDRRMLNLFLKALVITLGLIGPAMAQERILMSSDWGKVTAELVDNNATRSLLRIVFRRAKLTP